MSLLLSDKLSPQLTGPLYAFLRAIFTQRSRLFFITFLVTVISSVLHAKPLITLAKPDISAELIEKNKAAMYVQNMVREAFHRIGYDLNVVILPYERSLQMSNGAQIDGELVRSSSIELQSPHLIRVPEAVLDIDIVVISREPIDLSPGWNALSGKSVGWLLGMKVIEQNLPKTAHVIGVKSIKQLFSMLIKKRVDYVVFMESFGISFLGKESHGLLVNTPPLAKVSNYTYLHEKHALLVPKLAASLRAMKQDGTFQRIIEGHKNIEKGL